MRYHSKDWNQNRILSHHVTCICQCFSVIEKCIFIFLDWVPFSRSLEQRRRIPLGDRSATGCIFLFQCGVLLDMGQVHCGISEIGLFSGLGCCDVYRKTSKISHTLVSNRIVDHSDVVVASPVSAAPTTSSFSTSSSGLGRDNGRTRRETFKFWDLVWPKLAVLW